MYGWVEQQACQPQANAHAMRAALEFRRRLGWNLPVED
jgi:hypothetical protein